MSTSPAPSRPRYDDALTVTITRVSTEGITGAVDNYPSVDFQIPRILTSSAGLIFEEGRGRFINAKGNLEVKVGDALPCRVLNVRTRIAGEGGREVKVVVGIVGEWIEREGRERV